ncbi:MAG: DUF3800 domain-containing protein [Hyphomonadaceae bacterium]|nr:DUF3800 domain-containing protein [Hyphomonadaceae bacterium]
MPNVMNLYLDESGSRDPDKGMPTTTRARDFFAMGGVLINDEDEQVARDAHRALCEKWRIEHPLHSVEIRMRRSRFSWLAEVTDARRAEFYDDIRQMIRASPVTGIACVIDRPGYNARFRDMYQGRRWKLCKSAFAIVVERSVRFASERGRKLRVLYEHCGKSENAALKRYYDELRTEGMPFDRDRSSAYQAPAANAFSDTLYEFRIKQKSSPIMQFADLVLHPLGVAGYDRDHLPFTQLWEDRKLIDCGMTWADRNTRGTKYYCFTNLTERTPSSFLNLSPMVGT